MGGVGEEFTLALDRRALAFEQLVDRIDERPQLGRHARQRHQCLILRLASQDHVARAVHRLEGPAHHAQGRGHEQQEHQRGEDQAARQAVDIVFPQRLGGLAAWTWTRPLASLRA